MFYTNIVWMEFCIWLYLSIDYDGFVVMYNFLNNKKLCLYIIQSEILCSFYNEVIIDKSLV